MIQVKNTVVSRAAMWRLAREIHTMDATGRGGGGVEGDAAPHSPQGSRQPPVTYEKLKELLMRNSPGSSRRESFPKQPRAQEYSAIYCTVEYTRRHA